VWLNNFLQKKTKRALFSNYRDIVLPLVGRDMLNVGDSKKAEIYARKALAIAEELTAGDSQNTQARSDLAFAYVGMGDSLRFTNPATASFWYRKSISLTKELPPSYAVKFWTAERDEALAGVLVSKKQTPERLQLLQEANTIRQELTRAGPNGPQDRVHLMRSYCNLSDAELASHDLLKALRNANLSLSFFNEFKVTSPSLIVLREIGVCYENMGSVQRGIAIDRSLSASERRAADVASREWYKKSADVWNEWKRRGAATPESELERRKVERLLGN
jgi:eukaryotic-like serine/threonine-protein kinase